MATNNGLRDLCDTSGVSEEAPCRAELDGEAYAVFKLGGVYYVLADACTHGPGQLSEGTVIGGEIECPFHQGRFDIKTGQPVLPPCTEAVRAWTAFEVDGRVCIDPAERR
ncbi:MAG TPA: non-heme iron oxygenase ferredoxin subunit [Stellaceae bacterium]|nr:non-heme iron oxygenase ferredoxin subunit [Stellaceae bacterium]